MPKTDFQRATGLLDALVAQGLCPDGKDPGMKGVTRYVRLPVASNTKAKYLRGSDTFKCRMRLWNPGHTVTMDEIAAAYGIDLDAAAAGVSAAGGVTGEPWVVEDDLFYNFMEQVGMLPSKPDLQNKKVQVLCPNHAEHDPSRVDDGCAYLYEGGFNCFHGHCEELKQYEFEQKLAEEHPEEWKEYRRAVVLRDFGGKPMWTVAEAEAQEKAKEANRKISEQGTASGQLEQYRAEVAGQIWSPFDESMMGTVPPDVFPATVELWIREKAKSLGVDAGNVAGAVLGAASAAINGETRLSLKHDWHVPAALWIALVGDVSAKKTPVFDAATKALLKRTTDNVRLYDREVAKWRIVNDGAPKKQRTPFPNWREHYSTTDMTVEALASTLSNQNRGLCVAVDEIVVFIEGLGAYKKTGGGKDVGKMLSAFNGGEQVVHRASGGQGGGARTIAVDNWLVTVLGGIQPAKVVKLDDKIVRNGLMERFLPVLMGKAIPGSFVSMTAPDTWNDIMDYLMDTWAQRFTLSLDATMTLETFLGDLHDLRQLPFDDGTLGALGKLDGVVGRFALVLHMIEHATAVVEGTENGLPPAEVSDATFGRAIRLVREWAVPALIGFWDRFVSRSGDALVEQIAR